MTSFVPSGNVPSTWTSCDHLRHALHHVGAGQDLRAERHQLRDRPAVADALEDFRGDERDGFRMIQLETTRAPPARDVGGGEDQQLVDFAFGQSHEDVSRRPRVPAHSPQDAAVRLAAQASSAAGCASACPSSPGPSAARDRRAGIPSRSRARVSAPRCARPTGCRRASLCRPTETGRC